MMTLAFGDMFDGSMFSFYRFDFDELAIIFQETYSTIAKIAATFL